MKTLITALFISAIGVTVLLAAEPPSSIPRTPPGLPHSDRLPGVDLAEGISQITGVAISPLLGVSSVGAWRYYHTPETLRSRLPWFCSPGFWGLGFAVLGLCFLKDLFGTVAPPLIKKPFDFAELFESKLSALVASAAFIPFVAAQMAQHFTTPNQADLSHPFGVHYASIPPIAVIGFDLRLLFIPLCILAFLVVWLTGHAINVLIAFCPFGFIDTLLKLVKTALLSTVILSYIINPYLGAAVSLLIIFVAALLAPSAFRLMVFGTFFAADTIFPWRARRLATPTEPHAFVARKTAGVPARTYGRITRGADRTIYFSFRPWLILSRRTIQIPSGVLAVSKGVYFPSLLHSPESSDNFTKLILFLPRYRTRERAIAEHFAITDIRDSALTKGFKAVRAWLAETVNIGKTKYSEFHETRKA